MARSTPKQVKSAQDINKLWLSGMASPQAQAKYKAGIAAFTGNPMALADTPQAEAKFIANVQASVSSGKRSKALQNADPAAWKATAMGVGATNLGTGAQKKAAKQLKKAQAWQGVYQQASNAAAAIADDGGINAGKWQAAVQVMKAAKGSV